jgi:DUF2934 family protein
MRQIMEVAMQQNLENRIRERAYQLWEASGYRQGAANEHWLAAEREVLGAFAAAATTSNVGHAASKGAKKSGKTRRRAA